MPATDTIKVLIAEDHQIFAEGLKSVLEGSRQFRIKVVAEETTGTKLPDVVAEHSPDVILLDLNLSGEDGLLLLPRIKRENRGIRVIALTMYDDPKIVAAAFKAGANGYVLKGYAIQDLFKAIDSVMQGEEFIGQGVEAPTDRTDMPLTLTAHAYADRFVKRYQLTKREIEVLKLITQALSNKEIARELYISDQTVSVHRKNIMRKLGVNNTAGLLAIVYSDGVQS